MYGALLVARQKLKEYYEKTYRDHGFLYGTGTLLAPYISSRTPSCYSVRSSDLPIRIAQSLIGYSSHLVYRFSMKE
ncbi:HAT dimerization [Penicillium solitum]|uniref:HAT dimerization n=1 Tax=Penicillium solitum TaxID=60172 RepID=UPI0032C42B2C|nr:HAT dimerization [Penicillium solitum]